MSALQDVEAAIDKLTRLRDSGSSGGDAWSLTGNRVTFDDDGRLFTISEQANWGTAADMELIVALQRTIDAQLALLDEAQTYLTDWRNAQPALRGPDPAVIYRNEIELARSINREAVAE